MDRTKSKTTALWQMPEQQSQFVTGEDVKARLAQEGLTSKCLTADDLEFYAEYPQAIPENWWGKRIHAWQETVVEEDGEEYVCFLNCVNDINHFKTLLREEIGEIKTGGVIRQNYLDLEQGAKDFTAYFVD